MSSICVIGGGIWGVALASILQKNLDYKKKKCSLYTRNILKTQNIISMYNMLQPQLNNINICDIENFHGNYDIVFLSIPSNGILDLINTIKKVNSESKIVICSKGLHKSGFLASEILNNIGYKNLFVLSGGNFAHEVLNSYMTKFTMSSSENNDYENILSVLNSEYFLMSEYSQDIIGVQLCGILKNIYSIFIGIVNRLLINIRKKSRLSNTHIALIIDISKEIVELIKNLSNKNSAEVFYSQAGIGDLLLSGLSNTSRNFKFGEDIAKKIINNNCINFQNYIQKLTKKNIIEGYESMYGFKVMMQRYKLNINCFKILDLLYCLIFDEKDLKNIKKYLCI